MEGLGVAALDCGLEKFGEMRNAANDIVTHVLVTHVIVIVIVIVIIVVWEP